MSRLWVVEYKPFLRDWRPVHVDAYHRTRAAARTRHYNETLFPKRVVQYVRKERS